MGLGQSVRDTTLLLSANAIARRWLGYSGYWVDEDLKFDALQIHLASELIGRVKRRHPDARLGVTLLFRGYLMRALDRLLPKDVWIGHHGELRQRWPADGLLRCSGHHRPARQ